MKKILLLAISASVFISAPAWSQAENSETYPSLSAIPAPLRQLARSGAQFPEQYVDRAVSIIRSNGRDKTALDIQDIKEKHDSILNENRRRQAQKLVIYDSNFDGRVTRDEIIATLSAKKTGRIDQEYIDRQVDEIMAADENGDGAVVTQEMAKLADKHLESEARYSRDNSAGEFLALDPNGDGKLTVVEITALAHKAFRTIDANKDGTLSKEELEPLNKIERDQRELGRITSSCTMPQPAPGETIVFIGAKEGGAVSSVSVAGQMQETDVIPLVIDNTSRKLYIVAASTTPIIWQIKGAPSTISHLVVVGPSTPETSERTMRSFSNYEDRLNTALDAAKVNAGVVGLEANQVTFLHAHSCGMKSSYGERPDPQEFIMQVLKKLIGRTPDLYLAEKSPTALHILDDHITHDLAANIESAQSKTPVGFDENAWRIHVRFTPGGMIDLRNQTIISDAPAVPYEVLPRWAGVAKLVNDGALLPVPGHRQSSFIEKGDSPVNVGVSGSSVVNGMPPNLELIENNYAYKIVTPLHHFPPGMRGHQAMQPMFIIPKGMPMPEGDSGAAGLTCEEWGQQPFRGSCEQEPRQAMQDLVTKIHQSMPGQTSVHP